MRQHKGIWEHITAATDLNAELLSKAPLVELAGNRRVLIENHHGVIQYATHEICVKTLYGHISIQGNRLELAKMTKEQLIVIGCIDCVRLCDGRK